MKQALIEKQLQYEQRHDVFTRYRSFELPRSKACELSGHFCSQEQTTKFVPMCYPHAIRNTGKDSMWSAIDNTLNNLCITIKAHSFKWLKCLEDNFFISRIVKVVWTSIACLKRIRCRFASSSHCHYFKFYFIIKPIWEKIIQVHCSLSFIINIYLVIPLPFANSLLYAFINNK